MKWVNATLGIIEHPPAITIEPGGKRLEGLLYAEVFNGLYDKAKVDLNIIPITGDYGRCDEGGVNHTGAYKSLLINETNFGTILLDNLQCDDLEGITVGPLQLDHEQILASLKAPQIKNIMTADFTEIFKTVHLEIYIIYFITFLIIYYLWIKVGKRERKERRREKRRERKHWNILKMKDGASKEDEGTSWERTGSDVETYSKVTEISSGANEKPDEASTNAQPKDGRKKRGKISSLKVGWNLTTITLNQFSENPKKFNFRLIILIYVMLIFWLFQFLLASLTSDLAIERPVSFIDSLEDLANSDEYTAIFVEEYNAWRRFKESTDPIIREIWRKTIQKNGFEKAVLKLKEGPLVAYKFLYEKRVGLSVRAVIRLFHTMHCLKYNREMGIDRFPIIHQATDSFLSSIKLMTAFGPSIHPEAKKRLHWAYRIFSELGLGSYYQKNPQGILRLPSSEQVQCFLDMEDLQSEKGIEEDPKPLKPENFKSFTWICSSIIFFALIILIIERNWEKINI